MSNINIEEIDLLQELNRATESKVNIPIPGAGNEAQQQPPANSSQPPSGNDGGAGGTMDTEYPNDEFAAPDSSNTGIIAKTAVKTRYSPDKLAHSIVNGIEGTLEVALPALYQLSLAKEDRQALKQLARKYRTEKDKKHLTLDADEQRIMDIYLDYDEYCDNIALDKDEKESIIEPLAEMLKTVNYETTPGNALALAICIVVIPRLLPAGKNMAAKYFNL